MLIAAADDTLIYALRYDAYEMLSDELIIVLRHGAREFSPLRHKKSVTIKMLRHAFEVAISRH